MLVLFNTSQYFWSEISPIVVNYYYFLLTKVDEDLSYEQVSQLNYLDQVISETLRLFPPVVLMVTREAANDTEIGGYKIPAGTNIQIPIWQIHHDPELWPNPHLFDPDR